MKKKRKNIQNGKVFIPALFLKYPRSKKLILFSHGNATDLGQTLPFLQLLNQSLKVNVFGYDYQGYGIAKPIERPCSEKRIYVSIQASFNYVLNELKFEPKNIIIFGCSLGSAASVYLASNTHYHRYKQLELKKKKEKRRSFKMLLKRDSGKRKSFNPTVQKPIKTRKTVYEEKDKTTKDDGSATPELKVPLPNSSSSKSLRVKSSKEVKKSEIKEIEKEEKDITEVNGKKIRPLDEEDEEFDEEEGIGPMKAFKFRGVILQSAFTSALKTRIGVKKKIPFDVFENIKRAPHIDCPVFLIHGEDDLIVPFKHSLELNKVLSHPYEKQLYIKYAGHNNILSILTVKVYIKKLREFLKYLDKQEEEMESTKTTNDTQKKEEEEN